MKSILFPGVLSLSLLTACTSTPTIIHDTKYIVRTAPADIKALPEWEPATFDPVNHDDDAAIWIIQTEEHIEKLKAMITRLILFYERPIE